MLFLYFISFSVLYLYILYLYIKETGANTALQSLREYSDAELHNITKPMCFLSTKAFKSILVVTQNKNPK